MANLQIIESFLNYLLHERHFSLYTAKCYGADLRQLRPQRRHLFVQQRHLTRIFGRGCLGHGQFAVGLGQQQRAGLRIAHRLGQGRLGGLARRQRLRQLRLQRGQVAGGGRSLGPGAFGLGLVMLRASASASGAPWPKRA